MTNITVKSNVKISSAFVFYDKFANWRVCSSLVAWRDVDLYIVNRRLHLIDLQTGSAMRMTTDMYTWNTISGTNHCSNTDKKC